jgi:hypothetical protein
MKRVSALPFLLVSSVAYAQTTVTPAPATQPPAESSGGVNWLWILILLAIVAAAIWYFTKKKRGATTASGVAGVTPTAAEMTMETKTTGASDATKPTAGPNAYPSKDSKDLNR